MQNFDIGHRNESAIDMERVITTHNCTRCREQVATTGKKSEIHTTKFAIAPLNP
jgi:hypothetical protein